MSNAFPLLQHKRIVVIGGTSGLGLSAVRAFLAAGAQVVSVGLGPPATSTIPRSGGDSSTRRERINELPSSVRVILGDATKADTAAKAISECVSVFGGFDGLYHVAGGSGRRWGDGSLHEITDEGWRLTLELNLTSVFYSNRAAACQFLAQKTAGSILNLTSVLAWSPEPHYFATQAYAAAKSAIIGLTKSCAARYAPEGIRFNALAPGLTNTPMAQRVVNDPQIMGFIRQKQPLDGGRIGESSDLDAAAVYFMSDNSRFTTGQVLAVDGGWSVSEGKFPPIPSAGVSLITGPVNRERPERGVGALKAPGSKKKPKSSLR